MNDCRGQLLQRVRRGLASDQERTAFEAHLGSCESCRVTLEIADDFDLVGVADSEDAERVAKIATIARRVHEQRSKTIAPPGRSRFVWPLAAAALVLAGGAVAGGLGWNTWQPASPRAPKPAAPAPPPAVSPAVSLARASAAPEPIEEAQSEESKLPAATPAPKRAAPPPSAPELYRTANEARRGGRTAQAIATYRELQRGYPGSAEARLSHVSLGRLLLQSGSAGAALGQFDAYLAGGSGQRLAAEALFGRGQALQALGRRAEEVQNWRRLIGQYPDSAYATHANHRLEQLE
jgi:TolA-binding protein